jgi:hypothetical protein
MKPSFYVVISPSFFEPPMLLSIYALFVYLSIL